MDRLELMRTFVRVVETGSLSRAARELGTTQPTVSKGLRRLEEHVQARLLQRSTSGVRLTESGRAFYEGSRRALSEVEAAEAAARSVRHGLTGRLVMSFPVGLGAMFLSAMAIELQLAHAGLRLEIGLTDDTVDLVASGVDLTVRLGGPGGPTVVARPVGAFSAVLAATPGWLARHGPLTDVHELSRHNYLAYGSEPDELFLTPEGPVRVTVQGDLGINDHFTLKAAALAGRGVCRVGRWLVQPDLDQGTLVDVLPGVTPEPAPVYVVYLPVRPQPEKLKVAIAHLTQVVRRIPGWVPAGPALRGMGERLPPRGAGP